MTMNETPPTAAAVPQSVLAQAEALVTGYRQQEYASPQQSMNGIAAFWNNYIRMRNESVAAPLTAHDVAMMLGLMKVARAARRPADIDSYVDLAGYAGIAAEVRETERKAGVSAPTTDTRS